MAAMISQKEYFRQQAQQCRELAELISRPDLRARMLALADEHERIAADIEEVRPATG
jgi:hypothetical protein